jgi:hypothetical protein
MGNDRRHRSNIPILSLHASAASHAEDAIMTRQQRREAERARRKAEQRTAGLSTATDVLALLAATDSTVTGATLIMPDGEIVYLDTQTLRRGGGRA